MCREPSRVNATDRVRPVTERLPPDADGIARAASLLTSGQLVAFPTETVYGLGADGRNGRAVAALYTAKGRPSFNPLIAHLTGIDAARREGAFGPEAERLAAAFWPGPLTLVVPLAPGATTCDLARAGLASIGLRVPSHPVAQAVLERCGCPIVAPSANRSGHVSATTAAHVLADLDGRIDAVVMADPTEIGLESTIVACLGGTPTLLRPGGIARERIEAEIGPLRVGEDPSGSPLAPGNLASHYAPAATVRLGATDVRDREAVLLFGPHAPPGKDRAVSTLNLSPTGDLVEAAANLFGHLRRLDASGAASIAVVPVPEGGLGDAINDRLRRSAAAR